MLSKVLGKHVTAPAYTMVDIIMKLTPQRAHLLMKTRQSKKRVKSGPTPTIRRENMKHATSGRKRRHRLLKPTRAVQERLISNKSQNRTDMHE